MIFFKISQFIYLNRVIYIIPSIGILVYFFIFNFDISVLPISIIFFLVGYFFIIKFFNEKTISLDIYYLSFFTYLSFCVFSEVLYVNNPFNEYFYVPDSMRYYSRFFVEGKINSFSVLYLT